MMTNEELKLQCWKFAHDNQSSITASAIMSNEKRKSVEDITNDAQKIYDWVTKKE